MRHFFKTVAASNLPVPGGEIKRDPEIGKTAMQPEPAQIADLYISGSRLISSLCTYLLNLMQNMAILCNLDIFGYLGLRWTPLSPTLQEILQENVKVRR